jgi:hypothetical protein
MFAFPALGKIETVTAGTTVLRPTAAAVMYGAPSVVQT